MKPIADAFYDECGTVLMVPNILTAYVRAEDPEPIVDLVKHECSFRTITLTAKLLST